MLMKSIKPCIRADVTAFSPSQVKQVKWTEAKDTFDMDFSK